MALELRPPTYRWVPEYAHTNGDIAAEVGEQVGMPPDPQQQLVLDATYAEQESGSPACFEVAVLGPRQNLKPGALEIAALTDLFVFCDELVVWTAHKFSTARKAFNHLVQLVEGCDDFRRRCRKPRAANGHEAIETLTGQSIEFHARSKGGGRGLTGSKVILDEALFLSPGEMGALLPTMATIPGAQVRYASTAGMVGSEVLRGVRDRGRAGGDPSLAWLEWCAPRVDCEQPDCPHLPAGQVRGCALDDPELRRIANPSLGGRIPVSMLAKFRRAMPPEEYAREFLGWWEDPPAAGGRPIDPAEWAAKRDATPGMELSPVAFGVTVSPDRARTLIGVAGRRGDGRAQVELAAAGRGMAWAVDWLTSRAARWEPCAVLLDGTVAGLELPLAERKVTATITSTRDRVRATVGFYDAFTEDRLRHPGEPRLDLAVERAGKKPIGDGWVWDGAQVAPLVAVTLAWHGLAGAVDRPPAPPPQAARGNRMSETSELASAGF